VTAINTRLRPKPERPEASVLYSNAGLSFMGGKLVGVGLAVSVEEYATLVKSDKNNAKILRPYIGGEDVNSSTSGGHSRYAIDFTDYDLEEARRWPKLLKIVEERVKPARMRDNRGTYKTYWWKPGESAGALHSALSGLTHCLVTARHSKHLCISFQPINQFFSEALYIFALGSYTTFSIIQSRIHEPWARLLSSSLGDTLRYAASDCFDTFPFPRLNPREAIPPLEAPGQAFYEARARYVQATDQGLTKTYNALKDPENTAPAVAELRRLSEAMDRAVLDAYGWTDLAVPPYCPQTDTEREAVLAFEEEVIDRLHVLNAERAAEEKRLGLGLGKKGKQVRKPTPKPLENEPSTTAPAHKKTANESSAASGTANKTTKKPTSKKTAKKATARAHADLFPKGPK
jgi:hypothetical protein